MSTYKFKVLKGGKVYGEATTKAEAEAVAKKIGGTVAEVVGAKPAKRKPAAKKPKTSNPNSSDRSQKRVTVTLANGKKHTYLVYSTDDEIRAFNSGNVGYNDYGEPGPVGTFNRSAVVAVDIQPAKPKNPPLERANAAAKKRNPPLEPVPAAVLLDTVRAGVPQTFHGVKVELQPVVDGKPMQRWQALAAIEAGKDGKKANPKPKKPAARKPAKSKAKVAYI